MPEEVPAIALADVSMTEWIDFRGLIDNIVKKHTHRNLYPS